MKRDWRGDGAHGGVSCGARPRGHGCRGSRVSASHFPLSTLLILGFGGDKIVEGGEGFLQQVM